MAALVQILPKDFQVTVDQQNVKWVINAKPLTTLEWMQEHGLNVIESPSMLESDQ